ncbi:MAG: twin-arginine translocation signal domain-containing protein, partial [Planctomycetes bacterium]|nr:twin-arginine translocation signal domain-containing protein [Planctomycetota bacterium]
MALPTRRRFLQEAGLGFGSVALATLLADQSRANPLEAKPPHFPG